MNIKCWWFGCQPGKSQQIDYNDYVIYCKRCGYEADYSDLVGDTRHNRFKTWFKYWVYRKWFPAKCIDCGKRYGSHKHCLPF